MDSATWIYRFSSALEDNVHLLVFPWDTLIFCDSAATGAPFLNGRDAAVQEAP